MQMNPVSIPSRADGAEFGRYSVDIPVDEAAFERAEPQRLAVVFDGVTWKGAGRRCIPSARR